MTILVAASIVDKAALNIADKLIKRYGFVKLQEVFDGKPVYRCGDTLLVFPKVDDIYANNLDKHFRVEEVIFASRHKSETGRPTLTIHVPGNLTSQALYGGRPREVAWASPQRMKAALLALASIGNRLKLGYSISLEVTHHGPTEMSVPVTFVEIGSSEKQWTDVKAGEAVAEAIWAAITRPSGSPSAVGFGAGHYAPSHTRVAMERDLAIGHIIPKHVLENMDAEMVKTVFQKTWGGCNRAVLDWKGIRGEDRRKLLEVLKEMHIEVLRV